MKKIEVIKVGISVGEHECDWFETMGEESNSSALVTDRICRKCGRVEKESISQDTESFESIFEKFHGKE